MKIEVELSGPAGCGKTRFSSKVYNAIRHCIEVECSDLPKQDFEIIVYGGGDDAHYKPVTNR